MSKHKVGFIGLGNIGGPMAANLIGGDFQLTVFDVSSEALETFAAKGARVAASPAELATEADIIGICVRDDRDVDAVLGGADGLLAGVGPGAVIAIHSTVTHDGLHRWHAQAAERGVMLIDAPITGGAQGATDRALCYMVGGPAEVVERCRPVFGTSAQKIVHAGELGAGMALKMCNNMMTYAAFTAIHEAAKLAEACGLSIDVLYEVGQSNGVVTEQMHRFISNRESLAKACSAEDMAKLFGPFGALAEKDLDAALATAAQKQVELPAAAFNRGLINKVFLKQY